MEKFDFANPNVLLPDSGSDIQRVDASSGRTISLRCPHCSHVGSFAVASSGLNYSKYFKGVSRTRGVGVLAFLRVCPNTSCRGIVFVATAGEQIISSSPPELIDFDSNGLPANLLATLREAISCHAAGAYRASAMMVRRLLEEICDESGAQGKDLHARLIALKTKITLPEELFDAMGELKALGNDAAHITAKNYTTIGKDESEDSIELAKEILKARYQLKGLVDRLRARRGNATP